MVLSGPLSYKRDDTIYDKMISFHREDVSTQFDIVLSHVEDLQQLDNTF